MSAMVIALVSAKGGSGKTTVCASFAAILARFGKRVLVVDTDAATNGLTLMYLNEVTKANRTSPADAHPAGLFELHGPPAMISLDDGLDLLPATYTFRDTEQVDITLVAERLRSVVTRFDQPYDYILIDAQAGADAHAEMAASPEISDQVIIVSEYDPLSAAGVERLKALFGTSLGFERTWVLLNKMLPEFVGSFSTFLEVARYLPPIPWDADAVRSYARRSVAIDLDKGNDYTTAVLQTLRSLLLDDTRDELDDWLSQQARRVREPARRQYEYLQEQIEQLSEAIAYRRQRVERLRLTSFIGLGLATITLTYAGAFLLTSTGSNHQATVLLAVGVVALLIATVARLMSSSIGSTLDAESLETERSFLLDRARRLAEASDLSGDELALGARYRVRTPTTFIGRLMRSLGLT